MPKRSDNRFEPYRDQIAEMASQGKNTRHILEALGIEITKGSKEQLRRFLHSRGLNVAKQGGPTGEQNGSWRGGRKIDRGGYILLQRPDHPHANSHGYVREHRLVMEEHLGRYLRPNEVVHHRNGDTSDNRIENLELFESNAAHLGETLKGQVPDWTEDGLRRISEGVSRSNRVRAKKAKPNPNHSENDDAQ